MTAYVDKERKHAFVLKQDQVTSLCNCIKTSIGNPKIIIRCADDITREFDDLQSFSAYENARTKSIKRLTISAESDDYKKRAKIEFSDRRWRVIEIYISGSEAIVSNLYDKVSDIIDGTKPWYSSISKINFFILFFFSYALLYFITDGIPDRNPVSLELGIADAIIILLFAVFFTVLGWALHKCWQHYFPISFFAIGQGLERYKFDVKIRVGIVSACTAILLPTLVSFLSLST